MWPFSKVDILGLKAQKRLDSIEATVEELKSELGNVKNQALSATPIRETITVKEYVYPMPFMES